MAVYHFYAKYKDANDFQCSIDGLIEWDEEPSTKSGWLYNVRQYMADVFGENIRVESVQLRSLTRISG